MASSFTASQASVTSISLRTLRCRRGDLAIC